MHGQGQEVRLAGVERILAGDLTGDLTHLGIPASGPLGPSVADLAAIGAQLEADRRKLLSLK